MRHSSYRHYSFNLLERAYRFIFKRDCVGDPTLGMKPYVLLAGVLLWTTPDRIYLPTS